MNLARQHRTLRYPPKGAHRRRGQRQALELRSQRVFLVFWLTMIAAIILLWYRVISLLLSQGLS